ncbi:MAG: hypothetical protein WA965_26780, partial [Mycobacterium sp.]
RGRHAAARRAVSGQTVAGERDDPIRRSARRTAIRRHHPDAGGSAEDLIAALGAAERATPGSIEVMRTRRGHLRRIGLRLGRRIRQRRYVTLRDNTIQHSTTTHGGKS